MQRLVLISVLSACVTAGPAMETKPATETEPVSERELRAAYWAKRSDAELDAAFEEVCAKAEADGRPVLLTFSADWCPDCKRVYVLSKQDPLEAELAQWHQLVIHPGRFDRHQPVLAAFGVSKIVTWVAARPQDCRLPAPSWTRMREGTFEPATGEAWTAEALAAWLAEARAS